MEIQIQDLVQSIKHDGIEEARKEADAIVAAAKVQAAQIVKDSQDQAARNLEAARREIESSKALVKQAERDVILSIRKELGRILEGIMSEKVAKALDGKVIAAVISAAINGEDPAKYSVEIDETKASVKGELASLVAKGLEIKPVKGASLRLCCKDGSGFFDFSDEEIAQLLKPFIGEIKV